MKGIRLNGNTVETAVLTYRKGDRSIVLIGMVHWAELEYFSTIKKILETYDHRSYRILYERLGDAFSLEITRKKLSHSRKGMRLFERFILETKRFYEYVARYEGLGYQSECLQNQSHWFCNDLSSGSKSKAKAIRAIIGDLTADRIRVYTSTTLKQRCRHLNKNLIEVAEILKNSRKERYELSKLKPTIINSRDKRAIKVAFLHARTHNVVTYWGVAHIAGMVCLLRKADWRRTGITWIRAFKVPDPKPA